MKEYKKSVKRKEDIDFSLSEENGHFVCSFASNLGTDSVPVGSILYSLNGQLVSKSGLNLSGVQDFLSSPDHYPINVVFRSDTTHWDITSRKKLMVPVQDDFFGEITPLTDKEIEDYKSLSHSWVEGLLDATTSSEGFEYVCTRDDVKIYQGTRPGSQIHLIRGTTRVKSSREESRALMIAATTESFRRLFHMIDVHFRDGVVLHQFPADYKVPEVPFYSIKWAIMGSPGPVWERDVCWLEYGDIIHDNDGKEFIGFGVASSIKRPECPTLEHHKLVRAEIICTGYVFKLAEDDPDYMDVSYVIQADPKGWVPKWAVNMFAWQQALNVARIRRIIEGTLEAKVRMSHHKRQGAEIQGVLIPHGHNHTIQIPVNMSGAVITLGFCSNDHDIGFFITGLREGDKWSKMKRHNSHIAPVDAKVSVCKGEYSLVFDNSYSWFKSKQVYYWYRLDTRYAIQ